MEDTVLLKKIEEFKTQEAEIQNLAKQLDSETGRSVDAQLRKSFRMLSEAQTEDECNVVDVRMSKLKKWLGHRVEEK